MTVAELRTLVERGEGDTVLVVFLDLYGRFLGKRVPGGFFLETVADGGIHACNYLLTFDMEMEVVAGSRSPAQYPSEAGSSAGASPASLHGGVTPMLRA